MRNETKTNVEKKAGYKPVFLGSDIPLASGVVLFYCGRTQTKIMRNAQLMMTVEEVVKGSQETESVIERIHHARRKIVWQGAHRDNPFVSNIGGKPRLVTVGVIWWNDDYECPETAVFSWDGKSPLAQKLCDALSTGECIGYRLDKTFSWIAKSGLSVNPEFSVDLFHLLRMRHSSAYYEQARMLASMSYDNPEGLKESPVAEVMAKLKSMPETAEEWVTLFGLLPARPKPDRTLWQDKDTVRQFFASLESGASLLGLYALVTKHAETEIKDLPSWSELLDAGSQSMRDNSLDISLKERMYSSMSAEMSQIQFKGMPMDLDHLERTEKIWRHELVEMVEVFCADPEFSLSGYSESFKNLTEGFNQVLYDALMEEIKKLAPGVEFLKTPSGKPSISSDMLHAAGFHETPAVFIVEFISKLTSQKSRLKNLVKIIESVKSSKDGRLHAFLGFGPETDRLASMDPNIQNFDEALRRLVGNVDGKRILSADYGQVELRIAAALAIRAQQEITAQINNSVYERGRTQLHNAAIKQLRSLSLLSHDQLALRLVSAIDQEKQLKVRLNSIMESFDSEESSLSKEYQGVFDQWWQLRLERSFLRVLQRRGSDMTYSMLAEVFNRKIDPHLMTGLEMARRAGNSDLPKETNQLLDVLADHDAATKFKDSFSQERNRAKPINFGLIYGITVKSLHRKGRGEYNLTWSIEEADVGSEAFFDLYPELELWQAWTILTPIKDEWLVVHKKGKSWKGIQNIQCRKTRVWKITNLQGRVHFRSHWRQALNYQDQGTSAELLLQVMHDLPAELSSTLINQVHDELLFEVDDADSEHACQGIRSHMLAEANRILLPFNVQAEVDITASSTWS